jgi:glycosyltransferase involved in cell wall biosynthesis
VTLHVYGIQEDPTYWTECQRLIAALPANVHLHYKGPLSPDDVITTLASYDAFFLPTLGENFGHAIHEALLAGCPVLVSDRTPWRGLEVARAGFDLPIESPELFRHAIERFAAMPPEEHEAWSRAARALGLRYARAEELVDRTRQLLKEAAR